MDPKCSYMRFFAICQLLIVSQVSAKLKTKWGFFFQKPAKSSNIDKFTAGLDDCHEGFQFILWLHVPVYLSVFFLMSLPYVQNISIPFLEDTFSKNPPSPETLWKFQ